jgi:hypothetical protein
VEEFPVVARRGGWTVWGAGAEDPEIRVFVAENQELGGLRGQYDARRGGAACGHRRRRRTGRRGLSIVLVERSIAGRPAGPSTEGA